MKNIKTMSKKLIILSIVLLTGLSATLLNKLPEQSKKELPAVETETVKKIKAFNAKNYLEEYEHKKKAKEMLELSLKRNIPEQ